MLKAVYDSAFWASRDRLFQAIVPEGLFPYLMDGAVIQDPMVLGELFLRLLSGKQKDTPVGRCLGVCLAAGTILDASFCWRVAQLSCSQTKPSELTLHL